MINYWINSRQIKNYIYIPKYYNPNISRTLRKLQSKYICKSIDNMIKESIIEISTGDEIGKMAYGTGEIPFVRTSDISNWEIKTIPKQGISQDIYNLYSKKQDVKVGDILLVRDGTYLIGHNCFISEIDKQLVYQSHIIKIRIKKPEIIEPELFFLILNSNIVQEQMKSFQFTADIIDTLGQRFNEIIFPIPKNSEIKNELTNQVKNELKKRNTGKAFIKHCPKLMNQVLLTGEVNAIDDFMRLSDKEITEVISNDVITLEFGDFNCYNISSSNIINEIFIPRYYDPSIEKELNELSENCYLISMSELKHKGVIQYFTGDEIGKMAYGTGNIPFIRTSDFSNWEIKYNPKQGISEEIFRQYSLKQDVSEEDILLVRDGTYLIGSSCIITRYDKKSLFCGGLYKIRSLDKKYLNPYLLLGLLNSYIVKRQIRSVQFTRDVIDTIGNRLDEIMIPIPKNQNVKDNISEIIEETITNRINSRNNIYKLANKVIEE